MFKFNRILYLVCLSLLSTHINAQNNSHSDLIINKEVKHDLSRPLKDAPSLNSILQSPISLNKMPEFSKIASSAAPLLRLSAFQGLGIGLGDYQINSASPDLNGGTGLTQYFQFANPHIAVFSKTGTLLPGFPKLANSLWAGFGGACEEFGRGRITIKYDQLASRWVVSQLATENTSTGPFYYCVGVSTSDDATGTYNRYSYQMDSFSNYGELALWSDAYYLGLSMVGRVSFGPRMCALERDKMLAGESASIICKQLSIADSQPLMPTNLLGQRLPPAGTPGYFLGLNKPDSITFYKFATNFANPQLTTISRIEVPVTPYKPACPDRQGASCAIQPNTTNALDLMSDRLLTRIVFRAFAAGYGSLAAAHTIEGPQPKFAPAVRWYEFRIANDQPSRNPIVYQQGVVAPDSKNRFAPSINMDVFGNIAIGYMVSSSRVHPSLELAWRTPNDPLATMSIQPLFTGLGSQTTLSAWTRGTKLVTDPTNRCTMYYSGEYLKTTGSLNWSTAIVKFNLPGCE